ncbi:hypothetical protein QCA50_012955 [Cerrena zonata]|uniref:FAD-binding domain-containing protein n=1 Tax=Cerrena zonata TaxID=2478898 RepID=A0AAW0G0R9_9APHY
MTAYSWKPLDVVVLGGGLGGLAAAISMRRQGHKVRIYERYDYAGEVGASLSCASNGGKWLHEWGVNARKAKPVILNKLIKRDWKTGKIVDYAISEEGEGTPCELICNHKAIEVDYKSGRVVFENGIETQAELIIAADGIRSLTKPQLGIKPKFTRSSSGCIRVLFDTKTVNELNLTDFSNNDAIEFWGDTKYKVVLSPCSNNEVISCYCFYAAKGEDTKSDWSNDISLEELLDNVSDLDPALTELFSKCGYDIKQWRLTNGDGTKGVTLLGDSCHFSLPDQSQGAVQAFEDAGALGYIFSKKFNHTIEQGLQLYEAVRKPRVSKIQAASARARENLNERIGWSSGAQDIEEDKKLTIEEVCGYDMKGHIDLLANNNNH